MAKQVLNYALKEKDNSDDGEYKEILRKEIEALVQSIKDLGACNKDDLEGVQNMIVNLQEKVQNVSEKIGGVKLDALKETKASELNLYSPPKAPKTSKLQDLQDKILSNPIADSWVENEEATKSDLKSFVEQGKSDIAGLQDAFDMITSEKRKSKVEAMKEKLNNFCENLDDLVKENEVKVNPGKLNHNGKEFVTAIGQTVEGFENFANSALMSELIALLNQLSDVKAKNSTVGQMFSQILAKNSNNATTTLKDFEEQTKKLAPIIKIFLGRIDIPQETFDTVTNLSKRASSQASNVLLSGEAFLKDPKNGKTAHLVTFSKTVKELKNLLFATNSVLSTSEKLRGASKINLK